MTDEAILALADAIKELAEAIHRVADMAEEDDGN